MGIVAKIKNNLKPNKNTDKALLGISVGPDYYEDENLRAIVDVVLDKFNPENVTIMIADTLNAYNFILYNKLQTKYDLIEEELTIEKNLVEEIKTDKGELTIADDFTQARVVAKKEGDQWFKKNQIQLNRLIQKGARVITWDNLIQSECFSVKITSLQSSYMNKEQRKKLEQSKDVNVVLSRKCSENLDQTAGARLALLARSGRIDLGKCDVDRALSIIRDYLFEEGAAELVMAELFKDTPKDVKLYEIYPGPRNQFATFIHTNYIQQANILSWLELQLNKTPTPKNIEKTQKTKEQPIDCENNEIQIEKTQKTKEQPIDCENNEIQYHSAPVLIRKSLKEKFATKRSNSVDGFSEYVKHSDNVPPDNYGGIIKNSVFSVVNSKKDKEEAKQYTKDKISSDVCTFDLSMQEILFMKMVELEKKVDIIAKLEKKMDMMLEKLSSSSSDDDDSESHFKKKFK